MRNLSNTDSRLAKSLMNVATGGVLQILTIVLNLIVRIVFVRVIGYSYLGISSLFTNILTVLSVADLGFGTSISISLYSALKKGDKEHIAGILTYYKRIYLIIGAIVFVAGGILCPFVKYIVNTDAPVQFIELYFFIYLVNLVSTYFISYRHAIIKADQKNGILNNINSVVLLAKSVIELLVIALLPRFVGVQAAYITYLIVMVLSTYAIELWSARTAKKLYPYAFEKKTISQEEKTEIKKNVRSLLLYKVCNVVNRSADAILISIMVSTVILGKYSNYTLIVGTLMGFGCLISRNSIASLGNYVLTESKEKQIKMFYLISFIHIAIAAVFVINYVGILTPFFQLAYGPESVLSIVVLAFTAIHLAFDINYQVNELFRETTKMFRKIPYISAINLVLNIGFSILFGHFFGLEGIIGGTLLAYFLTSFWFETFALFKYHFKSSSKAYWLKLLYAVVSIGGFATLTYFVTTKIQLAEPILQLVVSVIISVVFSALCVLSFFWFDEFKQAYTIAKNIVISIYTKVNAFLKKENVQFVLLVLSIASIIILMIIRDVGAVDLNKFIFAAVSIVFAALLKGDNFVGYVLFLMPFYSGLPTGFIFPTLAVLFFLKNLKTFKNWKLLINYLLIPLTVFVLEMVMSTIYGSTTSVVDALSITSVLIILAFIIYDRKTLSKKPLYLFVLGAVSAGLVLFVHWVVIARYMGTHGTVKTMTFIRIMTTQRFGDIDDLIVWTETWCQTTYPYRLSMYLTDNSNYVALLMLSSTMTSVYLLTRRTDGYQKAFLIVATILTLFLGVYTGSKSFFICLMIFMLGFLLMLYAEDRINLYVTVGIIVSVGLATTMVCLYVPFVNEFIVQRLRSDSGRFTLIREYFKFEFSDPLRALFGVGISNLQPLSGLTTPPHNALAQIIGGYGLFGFSIILGGLVLTVWKARPKIRIIKDNILVSLVPLVTFIIFTMTSQIFLPPNTLLYGIPVFYIYVLRSNEIALKENINLEIFRNKNAEKRMMKWLKKKEAQKVDYKTVLVTGAAGFIGSYLCEKLLSTGNYKVVGLDNMNKYYDVTLKKNRLKRFSDNKNFIFIKGDISDRSLIDSLFDKYYFNIVVNLAGQEGARNSIDHPDDYIKSNVLGMYYILEACRYHPVEHLVFASSSSVYGDNSKVPFSTKDKVDSPVSLYAATKKSDELLAYSYSKLYNIPTTGLRFFTVYGPMGRPDMAYYSFTDKLVKGESIDLFNFGECKRDFTYIDDVIESIYRVIRKAPEKKDGKDDLPITPYKIYNIGNDNPEDLMKFVTILANELKRCELVSKDFKVKNYVKLVAMQKGDVPVTCADTSELEKDFGFKPNTPLKTGLSKFVEWYKEYYK